MRGCDMRPCARLGAQGMVPVERIELPTFGLQNRCSTAELNRRIELCFGAGEIPGFRRSCGRSNIRLARKGPEPPGAWDRLHLISTQEKGRLAAALFAFVRDALLADVPLAVFAPEIGAGLADEPTARVSVIVPAVPAAPAVPELVIAGVGISRSVVLAIGVWIELGAIAGIGDHLLRHHGACERG